MNFMRWTFAGAALVAVLAVSTALSYALTTSGGGPKPQEVPEQVQEGRQAGIDALEAAAPEPQRAAAADGVITFTEVNAAMAAYAECGEAAGFTPLIVPARGLRVMHVDFQIPDSDGVADDETVRSAEAALSACRSQYIDTVQPMWELQRTPPTDQQVAALYEWLQGCMAGERAAGDAMATWAGFYANAPADSLLMEIARADLRLYMRCAAEGEAVTGLKAPAPTSRPAGLPRP